MVRRPSKRKSPNRHKLRHSRRDNKTLRKQLMMGAMAVIPLLVLGGGGVLLNQAMNTERIDEVFCYDRRDQAEIAILMDNSMGENQSEMQLRDYVTAMENAWEDAPANARVSVFSTASYLEGNIAKPLYEMCKPATSIADAAALGLPETTPQFLARQSEEAHERFRSVIGQVLSDAQDPAKTATQSPIMEQLQSISRYRNFQGEDRRLIVITDGIQNSETARFCVVKGDLPSYSVFASQRRYRYVKPESLYGTDVSLLLVESAVLPQLDLPYCTHDEVRSFWTDYFEANDAKELELTLLRHGG